MAGIKKALKRDELKEIINKVIPAKERVELVAELARGIVMSEAGPEGNKVYGKAPDLGALRFLEEYATGKPVQVTDIPVESAFAFISVPKQTK